MSVDAVGWDETNPTNGDFVAEGDDNFRAIKTAIRTRLSTEHAWPASQVSSNQAGYHTYLTFSGQAAAPALTIGTQTQLSAIWCSSGSGALLVSDSAGTNYTIVSSGKGVTTIGAYYSATGTLGDVLIGSSGGVQRVLTASTAGLGLMCNSAGNLPTWEKFVRYSGTGTVSLPVVMATNLSLGGNTLTAGNLGVSSTATHNMSNGETFTVPAGCYVIGVARGAGGEIDKLIYATL